MASRNEGRNEDRSGTRNASGAKRQGMGAQPTADTTRQRSTKNSAAAPSNPTGATTKGSGTTSNAGASASAARGDQERELRTAREDGTASQSSASPQQQRSTPDRAAGRSSAPSYGWSGASPFALMGRMMEDMDRLFSDFGFNPPTFGSSLFGSDLWPSRAPDRGQSRLTSAAPTSSPGRQGLQRGGQQQQGLQSLRGLWAPQVEVLERGNNLVVRADLPGLSRDDVDVELDNDMLIIRGERHSDVEDDSEGFYRSERSYGSFYRAIPLPEGVDPNACNASFDNGVLELTLPKPKQEPSRARRIDVR